MYSDSLSCIDTIKISSKKYHYLNIVKAARKLGIEINHLPYSLRILLENIVRNEDDKVNTIESMQEFNYWLEKKSGKLPVGFMPARVLMQDFTGVPAIVDLATMRDVSNKLSIDASKINPKIPVDLVVDHSIQVDHYGTSSAFSKNTEKEINLNHDRYKFLCWGSKAFSNLRIVPPGKGICHQINLEYLGQVIYKEEKNGETWLYPDSLVGTDSHTTMINALAILGWGVGGIEAEAAMLGEKLLMMLPEVIGVNIHGTKKPGVTSTDIVLTITEKLRKYGVVGKFVEFFGDGIKNMPIAERATISNMAPEYGATCGFFPIDQQTLDYLKLTARDPSHIELVENYAKKQKLWFDNDESIIYTEVIDIDLATIEPCIAGPKRPQDRLIISKLPTNFAEALQNHSIKDENRKHDITISGNQYSITDGVIVIAAITSCTNTSNPEVMIAAGLIAKKAYEKGLRISPLVKTSLAPGSQIVTKYLEASGLQKYLDKLGFHLIGYGCTTCIGNSGPLIPEIEEVIKKHNLITAAMLSGNRNFENRIHSLVKLNYLASPPLVIAYALAGTVNVNLDMDPISITGPKIYLKDLWPSEEEIEHNIKKFITPKIFKEKYQNIFTGDDAWNKLSTEKTDLYKWEEDNSYIKHPPYFHNFALKEKPIKNIKARILAILGDSITTDHISPAGTIDPASPAGIYLQNLGIAQNKFNSYGSRRGNHEVMIRGTFANSRLRNEICPGTEGGFTVYYPNKNKQKILPIYDAAMLYQKDNTDLVVIAGKEYGTGSSRDWAAKGTKLLGIKAVIAESFERIHRANLICMGVLPLIFASNITKKDLNLKGDEFINIELTDILPHNKLLCNIITNSGKKIVVELIQDIYTMDEVSFILHNTILHKIIRNQFNKLN